MKQIFTFVLVCLTISATAQFETCPPGTNESAVPKFAGVPTLVSGTHLQEGAVYRYDNAVTSPYTMYALVTIVDIDKAKLVGIDERDLTDVTQDNRFQPQIAPDNATLSSDRRGLVFFRMAFFRTSNNIPANVTGLKFTHYDMDGFANGSTGWYREVGCITNETSILTSIIPLSNLLNILPYLDLGFLWKQFMGSKTEHTGISFDPEVALVANYNSTSVVNFRMGYDFKKGNGSDLSSPAFRQYAAKFGCFQFAAGSLPVNLSFFGVVGKDHKATANWTTETEVNHDRFELERSFDNTNFKTVALILGPKSSNGETKYYEYTDKSSELSNKKIAYYRLKQIDIDGKVTYSTIKLARFEGTAAVSPVQVSPNPFVEKLNLEFVADENGKAEIRIMNMTGQTLLSKQSTISKGYNSIQIDGLRGLASGMYMAQLTMNGTVINTQRVIKN
ncbi:MAG TPA: T9SS type A sorting domain-containing protein [Ferruginibacter sp.]|nr:T9SS type A sorting domain-containing protein [Ferruginibacter sp.]